MNTPERGSAEWIRTESDFIAYEATHIIDTAIQMQSSWDKLTSIRGSIDPNYKQIDVEYVRGIITAYAARVLNLPVDCCFVAIDYDRDYDRNRDYFNFEVVIANH